MRRLTLILSDLYLPAEAVRAAMPAVTRLPHLDALLRFSRSIPGVLGALALAGLVLAIVQIDEFDALATTNYGFIFTLKKRSSVSGRGWLPSFGHDTNSGCSM